MREQWWMSSPHLRFGPAPENAIVSPTDHVVPAAGRSIRTCGGAPTWISFDAVPVAPCASVTRSRTVNGPSCAYACAGLCAVEASPSPKSHAYDTPPEPWNWNVRPLLVAWMRGCGSSYAMRLIEPSTMSG